MTFEPIYITTEVPEDTNSEAWVKINQNLDLIVASIRAAIDSIDYQDSVISVAETDPPESPLEGDRYIVASVATGDWGGQEDNIAIYRDDVWIFLTPSKGWCCLNELTSTEYVYTGSSWTARPIITTHNALSGLNDGTTYIHLTSADVSRLANTSGTNTGDQTLQGLGGVASNDSRLSDHRDPNAHTLIDGTGHTASGLTTGHVIQATGETTYGFGNIGTIINAATEKTSPHADDMLPLMDSEASNVVKKLSWTYVKSVLKTYFDSLYTLANLGGVPTSRTVAGHALTDNVTISAADVSLGNVTNVSQLPMSYLDTDGTLTANSDTKVSSQKAVKTYSDGLVTITAGETLSQYSLVYAKSDGTFCKADANVSLLTGDIVGIVTNTDGIASGQTGTIKIKPGLITTSGTYTANSRLYLGTAGSITQDPSALLYTVPIGWAVSTTQILFDVQNGWETGGDSVIIDTDQMEVTYSAAGYTQTSTPSASATTQLAAHLKGISDKLAEFESRIAALE